MKFIAAIFLGLLIFLSLLFSGFCFSKMRWLSKQEKLDLAAQYVIGGGDYSPTYISTNHTLETRDPLPIHPSTLASFYKANPNCCEIVQRDPDGFAPSLLDALTGRAACMVRVSYSVQYIDKSGVISRGKQLVRYPVIMNCGFAWNGS